jgi:hypothetical protein
MQEANSMEESPFWEAYRQCDQEILGNSLNPKVHYRDHKSQQMDPIMS